MYTKDPSCRPTSPGQLYKINGGYTCTSDPADVANRFNLGSFIGNEEDALVLVIALMDVTPYDARAYDRDDKWFFALNSFGKLGWIPVGDVVAASEMLHSGT
jgi:hypothetical protein